MIKEIIPLPGQPTENLLASGKISTTPYPCQLVSRQGIIINADCSICQTDDGLRIYNNQLRPHKSIIRTQDWLPEDSIIIIDSIPVFMVASKRSDISNFNKANQINPTIPTNHTGKKLSPKLHRATIIFATAILLILLLIIIFQIH